MKMELFEKSGTRKKTRIRKNKLDKTTAMNYLFSDRMQKVANLFLEQTQNED